jgi:hypothetical protein
MDGYLGALEWRPCAISPLNGPANTRDLDYPPMMSGFKQAAPGPEFFQPETKPKFRPVSPARDQIPKNTCRIGRANAGFSRKGSINRDSGNCVVGPGGLTSSSIFKDLRLQTFVSVRFDAKGIFGVLTNLERAEREVPVQSPSSLYPRKRTCAVQLQMSALGQ